MSWLMKDCCEVMTTVAVEQRRILQVVLWITAPAGGCLIDEPAFVWAFPPALAGRVLDRNANSLLAAGGCGPPQPSG